MNTPKTIEQRAMDLLKDKWSHLYAFGYPQKPYPTNYESDLNCTLVGMYNAIVFDVFTLMHDTMNKTARIKSSVHLLQMGNLSKDDESKLLSAIDTSADELNKVLDAYYINQKQLETKNKSK